MLVNDEDEYQHAKGNIYDFLGDKIHEETETIITRLKTINNSFDSEQYYSLGFDKKPKNTELLKRLVELSKQEKTSEKVETTDELEIQNSE